MKNRHPALAVPAAAIAMLVATCIPPAHAQEEAADAQVAPSGSHAKLEEVLVTGSHIRGASDSGAIAVSIMDADRLESLGVVSTGDMLENLAQAGTFEINDSADGPNDARGDIATVNLRGLGTGNTLVLLNGRRIAAHGVSQDIGSTPRQVTNVNAFPAAGIDRIEVLRDGASALYGSDATAGVVNTILTTRFDKTTLSIRGSTLEGTDHDEISADFATGHAFNGDRTRVLFVGSYFTRNGLYARELGPQFSSVDKRAALGDSPYATANTDFRNTSTSSPFGVYQAGTIVGGVVFDGQRVRQGTASLTSSTGRFHIQPCSFPGTRATLGTYSEGCMGLDDGSLDTGLRFDFNANQPNNSLGEGVDIQLDPVSAKGRQMITEADRINAYALLEHDIGDRLQAFGELLFYNSSTDSNRAAQPMDSGLAFLIVPKENYWNPFGQSTSPNRLPGLNPADVPAEGLDVLIEDWRPTDLGPRFISTESTTYRVLGGLRGGFGGWDWEGAVTYSANETRDTESNRLSKTLLQAELARPTPDAINPFGGPNANTQAQWDRVRISSTNEGSTGLATADFRMSNSGFANSWAGPIGLALGTEWRRESYDEDRDPRLDGTIIYSTDNVSGRSDVVGVSPTADSSASRNVFSAFAESIVPLHRGTGTFVNDLTLQLAVRGEYFDDVGDGAVKPKIALSWFPVDFINFRAAYSQGFRAPNLVQLNRGDVSRLNLGNEDFWRAPVTGDPVSIGEGYMASIRKSNPDLENEDTETTVIGAVFDFDRAFALDWLDDLRFSVDYWRFEQTDLIGVFGVQEALALDYLLRRQGSSNPNVVRAPVTDADRAAFDAWNAANPGDQREATGQVLHVVDPYINLDRQVADGFDIGLAARIDAGRYGRLSLGVDATYLKRLDLVRNAQLQALADDPGLAGVFDQIASDRIERDGNPKWRTMVTLEWSKAAMGVRASWRHISGFDDLSADPDLDGDGLPDYWRVQSWDQVNLSADYRFHVPALQSLRLRVGANNVLDEAPPLVDDSLGYSPEYHSLKGRSYWLQVSARF